MHPDPRAIERVERPQPPARLNGAGREVWIGVADSLPADWFNGAALPVLEQYCAHAAEARRLGELISQAIADPDLQVSDYDRLLRMRERESRAMVALATKMKITQQSTTNHRGHSRIGAARKPWEK